MSNPRGIFDSFPGQAPAPSPFALAPDQAPASPFAAAPATTPVSPFAAVHEASPPTNPFAAVTEAPPVSPFAAVARPDSPFATADDVNGARPLEPGKPARLPEKRKAESPFQAADPKEGFGFEAAAPAPVASQVFAPSPFEVAPASSPFAVAPPPQPAPVATPVASPFSLEPAVPATPAPAPAPAATWSQPQAVPAPAPAPVAAPVQAAVPAVGGAIGGESDSASIRQLELRAIFGVDREMSPDEILQRARALPGIRHIARVASQDIATIDSLKNVIANLGFGSGGLRLFAGSVPVEFIREGNVMLAVQTDGGFAPGVRETLMIVGRELGRSA
ncbi:hypothetical protein [Luteolibacter sp. LG18]|uniref:hypothetical protein n=1 Tax=Luteolibacter sp. LG18 TaxID=2819286 RepID=UPI002B27DADD|nr:hypothetical protein llg_01130 [Luteolibacter sp. LG18]